MTLSIAVCDDSQEYGEIVTHMIKEVTLKENIDCNISTYNLGRNLVQAFKENEFNIIFLDMEMPELNGIETGLLIREISKDPVIFYLTSHKEYAYESYQVKARNYILKPASVSVIERVLLDVVEENKKQIKILDIKDVEGAIHCIPIKHITHILRKKEDRKLHIYTLDSQEIVATQTLDSIEKELAGHKHVARASKSCIVNIDNIRVIRKNVIYFSNEVREEASRRCLSELVNKFRIKNWRQNYD